MDLLQLRYFCEVAETEHMTKSAQRLRIAQPALSQTILKLENELGCKLFDRTGRRIKLNANGRHLKQKAEKIISEVDSIPANLGEFQSERERLVSIDIESALGTGVRTVAAYKKLHPNALFKLSRKPESRESDIVVEARASLQALAGGYQAGDDAFEFEEDICLAVSRSCAPQGPIGIDELESLDLVALSPAHSFRLLCDQLCAAHGIRPNITFESECTDSILAIVELGCGAALIPAFSWTLVDSESTALVPIDEPGFKRRVCVTMPNRENATGESVRFFEFFKQRVFDFYAEQANVVSPWRHLDEVTPWARSRRRNPVIAGF